jgi:hypothetical protein
LPIVDVSGWRVFRQELKHLDPEADKALRKGLREIGVPVLTRARSLAPRDTGELSRSIRLSVTKREMSIYSTLPQAPVLHWGGTISPRGTEITFPRTEFATRAVMEHADKLIEGIGDNFENAATRLGWRKSIFGSALDRVR